jgi:hypothetical protein
MSGIYISRSTAVAARELGGEMMIMSATDSTLFSLNETATIIWNAADGQTPLTEIVECKICQEFNVQPEEAYRDAQELVQALAALGILHLSEQAVAETLLEVTQKS